MRKIVIHHIYLIDDINKLLQENDLLFFDDCLYSQYVYIKENINFLIDKNINCILGLSPKLIRKDSIKTGIFIESYKIHDDVNKYIYNKDSEYYSTAMNGFMSLSEIKELLQYKNIKLGLHGCCHLKLEYLDNMLSKITTFIKDTKDGIKLLKQYNLFTNIYVYPYEYKLPIFDHILRQKFGFTDIYGADDSRIYIEKLTEK